MTPGDRNEIVNALRYCPEEFQEIPGKLRAAQADIDHFIEQKLR